MWILSLSHRHCSFIICRLSASSDSSYMKIKRQASPCRPTEPGSHRGFSWSSLHASFSQNWIMTVRNDTHSLWNTESQHIWFHRSKPLQIKIKTLSAQGLPSDQQNDDVTPTTEKKKISRRITGSYSLCSNQSEIKESQSSQSRLSSYYGCRVQVKVDLCLCSCIFSPPFLSIHKHELMGGSFHACPDLWLPTPGLGFNRSDV